MDKLLNELMGSVPFRNRSTQTGPDNQNINQQSQQHTDQINISFNLSHCRNLRGFQLDIISSLKARKDVFVVANPGAGKTLPIVCYWANYILNLPVLNDYLLNNPDRIHQIMRELILNRGKKIDKIIWLVPTRQLVDQTSDEFTNYLVSLIFEYFNFIFESLKIGRNEQNVSQESLRIFNTFIKPMLISLNINQNSLIHLDQLFYIQLNGQQDVSQEISKLLNHIFDTLSKNIMSFVHNNLINTMSGVHNQGNISAPIQIAIYESFASFANGKGKNTIKSAKLLIIDEAHWLQHSGQEYDTDTRYLNILESVASVINKMDKKNYQLVFLSGTINPESARSITSLLDKCIGSNFVIKVPNVRNPSDITIIPDDRLTDENYIVNLIIKKVSSNQKGIAFVLFSKNRIRQIVEKVTKRLAIKTSSFEKPTGSQYHNGLYVSDYTKKYHKQKDLPLNPNARDKFSPTNIHNDQLREAVLRGIGWIFRLPEDAPPKERQDNAIVANLFTNGKIKVLLCTDAVGIGMNIKIREMYIPYIEKYSDFTKNNIQLSLRELAQIVHRTGRDQNIVGTIYTPTENINTVTKALYAKPQDFPRVDIDYSYAIQSLKCNKFNKMFATIMSTIFTGVKK